MGLRPWPSRSRSGAVVVRRAESRQLIPSTSTGPGPRGRRTLRAVPRGTCGLRPGTPLVTVIAEAAPPATSLRLDPVGLAPRPAGWCACDVPRGTSEKREPRPKLPTTGTPTQYSRRRRPATPAHLAGRPAAGSPTRRTKAGGCLPSSLVPQGADLRRSTAAHLRCATAYESWCLASAPGRCLTGVPTWRRSLSLRHASPPDRPHDHRVRDHSTPHRTAHRHRRSPPTPMVREPVPRSIDTTAIPHLATHAPAPPLSGPAACSAAGRDCAGDGVRLASA